MNVLIVEAAVKLTTGGIITGHRHCDCFRKVVELGLDHKFANQGFMTNIGCFLDRKTSAIIAFEAGQIKK